MEEDHSKDSPLPKELVDNTVKTEESLEARKARINGLWSAWDTVSQNGALVSLFDRKTPLISNATPAELLQENEYPPRTKIPELLFETWAVNLDPKFCKDGYIYLLRGDHPGLEKKGIYSRPYGYGKKTTKQLTQDLATSEEVGYFLYKEEAYLKTAKPSSSSIAQELAFKQSQIGGSSYVSATTNIDSAIAGTGNDPDPEEQQSYEVYVLRIPIDAVINSNTDNYFGMNEDEYLIPDYVTPEEIIAHLPRNNRAAIVDYLSRLLEAES